MKKYTEEELEAMAKEPLKAIIRQLADKHECVSSDICPKYAGVDLMISSILEAQEEAFGQ